MVITAEEQVNKIVCRQRAMAVVPYQSNECGTVESHREFHNVYHNNNEVREQVTGNRREATGTTIQCISLPRNKMGNRSEASLASFRSERVM